jgi:DNA-binding MarR family transcriptional regulator
MLSRVVGQLVEQGLVERVEDPGDRRAALVVATAEGRKLRDRMRRERSDAVRVALDELSGTERAALARALPVLERLADELQERRP